MYYEFYIDVYFLENLVMNYLILRMTGKAEKCACAVWRTIASSVLGAVCACAIAVAPVHRMAFLSVTLSFLYGVAMVAVSYGAYGWDTVMRTVTVFYLSALLLGAIWQLLERYLHMSFFAAMPVGYVGARAVFTVWQRRKNRAQYVYEVTITEKGKTVSVKGLMDSGNQLVMPGTGKPVQIVDFQVACALLSAKEIEELECMLRLRASGESSGRFTYIPYHSIGKERGILPVMTLDSVRIKHGESVWNTKKVAAAISKTAVSYGGEYQMILHPQIIE